MDVLGGRELEVTMLPADADPSPPRRRVRDRLLSAGELLIAAALVIAAVATVSGRDAGDTAGADRHRDRSFAPATGAGSCRAAGRAPTVGWIPVAGVRVPVSTTLGPADLSDGLARGFCRSAAGAAIAAANIWARSAPEAGTRVFGPTIDRQVFDTLGDRYIRAVSATYQRQRTRMHVPAGDPLPGSQLATVAGYRIEKTNPRKAAGAPILTGFRLHLLLESPAGRWRDLPLEVRWLSGDWRLYAPRRAAWLSTAIPAAQLAAYVPLRPWVAQSHRGHGS